MAETKTEDFTPSQLAPPEDNQVKRLSENAGGASVPFRNREAFFEKAGLVEPEKLVDVTKLSNPDLSKGEQDVSHKGPAKTDAAGSAQPAAAQPAAPAAAPAGPVGARPDAGAQPDARPAQPGEPAPTLYAGKYKSVDELTKGYENANQLISKQGQELAELKKALQSVNAAVNPPKPAEPQPPSYPDPIIDPAGYANWAAQQALQVVQRQREAEAIEKQWEAENQDILPFKGLVTAWVTQDRRAYQPGADLIGLIKEHTAEARKLANGFIARGQQEAAQRRESVPPVAPQNAVEAPPKAEPAAPLETDDVDDFISQRNARRAKALGRSR